MEINYKSKGGSTRVLWTHRYDPINGAADGQPLHTCGRIGPVCWLFSRPLGVYELYFAKARTTRAATTKV